MLNPVVAAYLEDNREDLLVTFAELLRFESFADVKDPDGCTPCAQWLAERLEALGMQAEVLPSDGPPVVVGELHVDDSLPTLLCYAHYDVQPVDPIDEWDSPPFEATQRDGFIYARGATDDKGQLFCHLAAIEAWVKAVGQPPVNLKVCFEGEEEVGSPHMEAFLREHGDRLAADALVVMDSGFYDLDTPAITYALRGLCYFEVIFTGPSADLHSGMAGGVVRNPLNALTAMVGRLHDERGRVQIPGFYDDVLEIAEDERAEWDKLGPEEDKLREQFGVEALTGGEAGYSPRERRWARPTCDCNGLWGGYTGAGSKTVLPARAQAKISMRLVSNQDPAKIEAGFRAFVAAHTPEGITSQVKVNALARPVLFDREQPAVEAARRAFAEVFDREAVLIRMGASIPISELFQRVCGIEGVVSGIAQPDAQIHSPNERIRVEQLLKGMAFTAAFYQHLADVAARA
jgi:acetylornithine deacetylase/succinyl-diaminopimelate desuccinylase-like protein